MRDALWSLAPCLENLRYTTGDQDEIIVVDDGSIGPAGGFARQLRRRPPAALSPDPQRDAARTGGGVAAGARSRVAAARGRDGAQLARRRRLARASGGPPGRPAAGRCAGSHVDAGRGRAHAPALLPAGAGAGGARRDRRFGHRASARGEPRRPGRGGAAAGAAGVRAARATAGDRAPDPRRLHRRGPRAAGGRAARAGAGARAGARRRRLPV